MIRQSRAVGDGTLGVVAGAAVEDRAAEAACRTHAGNA